MKAYKSIRRGIVLQQENALKTLLCVCVCAFPWWSHFVVFFIYLFYSTTLHSSCQLADSCFIIPFQNLNPKK